MGLEHIVIDHGNVLPATDIARLDLFDVTELAENLVGFVLKRKKLHAIFVKFFIAEIIINAGVDERKNFFSDSVTRNFLGMHCRSLGCMVFKLNSLMQEVIHKNGGVVGV